MRIIYPAIAVVIYAIFFATFLYLIGFVADAPMLPVTVDRGPAAAAPVAVIVDMALVLLFGLQHSVMARQGFKRAWTKLVPPPLERSFYVLAASVMLDLLFVGWRPLPMPLWSVGGPLAVSLWVLCGLGWATVLLSTFLIDHFELFGLAQTWRHWRGRQMAPPRFRTPVFYRMVRHPLYLGFVLAFWATPHMTMGHALLALGMTVYILIAIGYEERDLLVVFGEEYRVYRQRVGMLLPGIGRSR